MQEIIKNVPLFASRVHVPRRKLLKDLSWNMPGWPSEGIAPGFLNAVNCNLKSIKMVFNYNRFTGDTQETENWAEALNVMYAQDSIWALGRECT